MCGHSHTHGRHRNTLKLNSLLLQPLQHGALTNYRCSVLLQQKNDELLFGMVDEVEVEGWSGCRPIAASIVGIVGTYTVAR